MQALCWLISLCLSLQTFAHTDGLFRILAAIPLTEGNKPPGVIQSMMCHSKFTSPEKYIRIDTTPMHDAVNA